MTELKIKQPGYINEGIKKLQHLEYLNWHFLKYRRLGNYDEVMYTISP